MIRNNTDFPQIIINSIPAPELVNEKVTSEELHHYILGLRELDGMGVDFIVMVCNTIHIFYEMLQREIGTRILDLRKAVYRYLQENGINSYVVLGTPLTINSGLYDFNNMCVFKPSKEELELLAKAIFDFNRGKEKNKQVTCVENVCQKYIRQGAKAVLLACTEFAVMLKDSAVPAINTIDVLVEATFREVLKIRKL